MIPLIAVISQAAVETSDGSAKDAAPSHGIDAGGEFFAAMQQLLDVSDESVASRDQGAETLRSAEFPPEELLDQASVLTQGPELVARATPEIKPYESFAVVEALHWLMLPPNVLRVSPGTIGDSGSLQAASGSQETLEAVALEALNREALSPKAVFPETVIPEAGALDGADRAWTSAESPGITGAAQAAMGVGTAADTVSNEASAVELAVDAPAIDPQRSPPGLEQNPLHRSVAEPATRVSPPPVLIPLHSPQWGQEFAARVNWLVDRGDQFASIRLTPEQLGPVEVRVAIREGEASIWFGATQPETRAAIEQALPRLREMLAASGLSLADSGVFQQSPRDPRPGFAHADARRAAMESAGKSDQLLVQGRHLGLIDDYA